MNDPKPVTMSQTQHKLLHVSRGFRFRHIGFQNLVVEGKRLAEIDDELKGIIGFKHVVDLNDVGVRRQKGHDFGFVLQTFSIGGVGKEAFVDGFTGEGGFG